MPKFQPQSSGLSPSRRVLFISDSVQKFPNPYAINTGLLDISQERQFSLVQTDARRGGNLLETRTTRDRWSVAGVNEDAYHNRKKLEGRAVKPPLIHFGDEVAEILRSLPAAGALFPYLSTVRPADRATEFKQRCQGLKIAGVTLHSYRYAWAERARRCGYLTGHKLQVPNAVGMAL